MSLLFIDGFDHYDDMGVKWDGSFFGGNIRPVAGTGRFGGQALRIQASGGAGTRTKSLTTSVELIAGFAIKLDANYDIRANFGSATDDTAYVMSADPVTGVISFIYTSGGGAPSIATPPSTVSSGTWFYVEIRAKGHPSLGELEIRVNGTTVASAVGLDTADGGGDVMNSFSFQARNNGQIAHVDSLYVLDTLGTSNNNFIGDSRVTTHYPKDNGVDNNFFATPTGFNYLAVDEEIFDDDDSFVESGIIGAKDNYVNQSFVDIGVSPGTVFGVQVVNASLKTDAATLKYRDQMIVNGIAYDTGIDTTATASIYKMTTFIRDTDPSDDATWTEAKVDAVGSGIEITFRQI